MAKKTREEKELDKEATLAAQGKVRTMLEPAGSKKPANPPHPEGTSKEDINARAAEQFSGAASTGLTAQPEEPEPEAEAHHEKEHHGKTKQPRHL